MKCTFEPLRRSAKNWAPDELGGIKFGPRVWSTLVRALFVGDQLAELSDVLFEFRDFVRPGAFGVRVGFSGYEPSFGLGEAFGDVVESVL